MDPWTSYQRNDFINLAINSEKTRGYSGPYHYIVFPKNNGRKTVGCVGKTSEDKGVCDHEEEQVSKTSKAAKVLAHVIFNTNPAFRNISLNFYDLLIYKILNHPLLCLHANHDIVILMKGSNAYAFLLEEKYPDDFPFSDMDLVIYINPNFPTDLFNSIKEAMSTVVLQTISQYKRTLDHMFCINKPINDSFMSMDLIDEFKKTLNAEFENVILSDGVFMSPFENDSVRNSCSRNSFMIADCVQRVDCVVRIDVPHFDKCDRIPLRKSPIFGSYNSTISFQREKESHGEESLNGVFDLYRLRWSCLFVKKMEDETMREERVATDFIDVSIAAQTDAELLDFWSHGRCVRVLEKASGLWLTVPDLETCIDDLHKMLYVYECPEEKRTTRLEKYAILKSLARRD